MKNTALILAFIMCFVSYHVFAGGEPERKIVGGKNTITGGTNAISGGTTTVSGGPTTVSGGTTAVSGGTTAVSGGTTTVSGGTTAVSGGTTTVSGGTTTVSGGNIIVPGAQGAADRIPVTSKIVEFMLKKDGSSDGLKFYLSKPFTLKIYEQKETHEVEIVEGMVILNPANPADEK
jgi:hypothetical protein